MSVSYPSTMVCNQKNVVVIFLSTASGGLNTLCVVNKLCEQWLFCMASLIFYKSESSLLQHLCLGLISSLSMREDHSLSAFAKKEGPRMDDSVVRSMSYTSIC